MSQHNPGQPGASPAERLPRQAIPATLDPLVREPVRRQVTGLSRSAWYELMGKGEAPKPLQVGARAVAWRASDLQKWIDARVQQGAAQ